MLAQEGDAGKLGVQSWDTCSLVQCLLVHYRENVNWSIVLQLSWVLSPLSMCAGS